MEAECNCPYTGGPYCKHMVAVFLALRKEEIRAAFSSGSDEKEKWIRVMQRYIEQAEDEDGFINYEKNFKET